MRIRDLHEPIEAIDADLANSHFTGVKLDAASLSLAGARFTGVDLTGAAIAQASLSGVTVRNRDISGMLIDDIQVTDALAAYRKTL